MNFENRPTHSLRPYPGNARTHSPKQIKQISRSIERFGFNNPVLVDDDDQIIAGHGRVEAISGRSTGRQHCRLRHAVLIEFGLRSPSPENGNIPVSGQRLSALSP
jgi:ParB-like nuclease domain